MNKNGGFRLIACDLDGTLISHSMNLPESAKNALNAAKKAGCIVIIATGRSQCMIPKSIFKLPSVDAVISSNGARIIQKDGKLMRLQSFNYESALSIIDQIVDENGALNVFFDGKALFDRHFIKSSKFGRNLLAMLFRLSPYVRSSTAIRRYIQKNNICIEKIDCVFETEEKAARILTELQQNNGITPVTTMGKDVEITSANVSKGNALSYLCKHYNIQKEHVLVCGNSGNDMSMRPYAQYFAAPKDSSADILEKADIVLDSAENDGIAKWLLELFGG